MFVSNPSTLAHICQSIRYNLVSVLLLSRFVKVRCLSHGVKATLCPKSNPIHTIFTNCAPFPLHFHSISISIWISTPLKGSSRDVIPSAARSGGPRRAYRTRALCMRHGIIFRSRTVLSVPPRLSPCVGQKKTLLPQRRAGYGDRMVYMGSVASLCPLLITKHGVSQSFNYHS